MSATPQPWPQAERASFHDKYLVQQFPDAKRHSRFCPQFLCTRYEPSTDKDVPELSLDSWEVYLSPKDGPYTGVSIAFFGTADVQQALDHLKDELPLRRLILDLNEPISLVASEVSSTPTHTYLSVHATATSTQKSANAEQRTNVIVNVHLPPSGAATTTVTTVVDGKTSVRERIFSERPPFVYFECERKS